MHGPGTARRFWLFVIACVAVPSLVRDAAPGHHRHCCQHAALQPGGAGVALPAMFVENRGQWRAGARFAARFAGLTAGAERASLALALDDAAGTGGVLARLEFEGASPSVEPAGEDRLDARLHFLLGNEPAAWQRDVRAWRAVTWNDLYHGVDLRLYAAGGRPEYDLMLRPGAALDQVVVRCDGIESLQLDADGTLVLQTAVGALRQPPPRAFTIDAGGTRQSVPCRYVLLDDRRFGFAAATPDQATLLIDPQLVWGTYFGGTRRDEGFAVDVGDDGDVTFAGPTLSFDLPTTTGAYDRTYNGEINMPWQIGDTLVARFDGNNGQLLWATFLGGAENDQCNAMHVLPSGSVIVSGWTTSTDFPVTAGAFDTTFNGAGLGYMFGGGDIFVSRLGRNGDALEWSTFLGGNDLEYVLSLDVDASGAVTVSGHVHSLDFPTTPGALSRTMSGLSDMFVSRLHPNGGSLLFSTFFGGTLGEEYGFALAVDASGATTIAGGTDDANLPVTPGAYDTTYNGGAAHLGDGFVIRLDATGSTLLFSTFLGTAEDEYVRGLAVDALGRVTVVGQTNSPAFPTTAGAGDRTHNGGLDAFVARLDANGATLLSSTYLGGSGDDFAEAARDDGSSGVLITGPTGSVDFPTTPGAFDSTHNLGGNDSFLAHIDTDARPLYVTLFGGSSWENSHSLALRADGAVALTGTTYSSDFPTTAGAFDNTANGGGDLYAVLMHALPTGIDRFGAATPGCAGAPVFGVRGSPTIGNAAFAARCARAPAAGNGGLCLSNARLTVPFQLFGADLWLDPTTLIACPPARGDATGGAEVRLSIPPDPRLIGGVLFAQFLWIDPCAPLGLSASNAGRITIQ